MKRWAVGLAVVVVFGVGLAVFGFEPGILVLPLVGAYVLTIGLIVGFVVGRLAGRVRAGIIGGICGQFVGVPVGVVTCIALLAWIMPGGEQVQKEKLGLGCCSYLCPLFPV